MNAFRKSLSIVLIGLNGVWLFASPIAVQAAGGLGIIPKSTEAEPNRSWFVYTMGPGDFKEDIVVVNNHSDKSMIVGIEAYDAQNTSNGSFTLVTDTKDNQDVGTWVTPSTDTITIPGGESKEVSFKITIPSNASVGQHSGAIAVYQKSSQSGGTGLKVVVGARIYITVPGTVNRKVTFDQVSHEFKDGKLVFHIKTTNHSNINLEPSLDIKLRGLFRTYIQTEDNNGTYLPGRTITISPVWNRRAPTLGYYRVTLVMNTWSATEVSPDGSTKELPNLTFRYSYGFWLGGPYFALMALILLLGWIGFRLVIWWRDRKKFRTQTEVYVVKKDETVMHISEKTGIFPQAIVKFNRLAWPYALNAGDRLMIPTNLLTPNQLYHKYQTESMPSVWRYLVSFRASLYHPSLRSVKAEDPTKASKPRLSQRLVKSTKRGK
jgi:hypothetical protein